MIKTANGDDWMVYHAYRWKQIKSGPGRVLCIDKIRWNMTTKWPFIGVPSSDPKHAPVTFMN